MQCVRVLEQEFINYYTTEISFGKQKQTTGVSNSLNKEHSKIENYFTGSLSSDLEIHILHRSHPPEQKLLFSSSFFMKTFSISFLPAGFMILFMAFQTNSFSYIQRYPKLILLNSSSARSSNLASFWQIIFAHASF